MCLLKVFQIKSSTVGAKDDRETSSLPAGKALSGHNFSVSPRIIYTHSFIHSFLLSICTISDTVVGNGTITSQLAAPLLLLFP